MEIPFKIEENENGTFAVVENPKSKNYGTVAYKGDKVIRSPFPSREEALKREMEIGDLYEYKPIEIK